MVGYRPYPPDFDDAWQPRATFLNRSSLTQEKCRTNPRHLSKASKASRIPIGTTKESCSSQIEESTKTFPEECKTEPVTRSKAFEMSRKSQISSSNACSLRMFVVQITMKAALALSRE
jgi:hypothetical protein